MIRKGNNLKEVYTEIYVFKWDGGRENDIIIVPQLKQLKINLSVMKTVAEEQQSSSHINQGVAVHWVSFPPLHSCLLSMQPGLSPFYFPLAFPSNPPPKAALRKISKFSVSRNRRRLSQGKPIRDMMQN